jgi:hypothetical protein
MAGGWRNRFGRKRSHNRFGGNQALRLVAQDAQAGQGLGPQFDLALQIFYHAVVQPFGHFHIDQETGEVLIAVFIIGGVNGVAQKVD